jgi:hypothetical protein
MSSSVISAARFDQLRARHSSRLWERKLCRSFSNTAGDATLSTATGRAFRNIAQASAAAVTYAGVLAVDSAAGSYDIPAGVDPHSLHERATMLAERLL